MKIKPGEVVRDVLHLQVWGPADEMLGNNARRCPERKLRFKLREEINHQITIPRREIRDAMWHDI